MKTDKFKDKKYFFYYNDVYGLHGLENAFYQFNSKYIGYRYNRKRKGFWLQNFL